MTTINIKQLSKAIAGFQQCKEGYKEAHEDKIVEMCKLLPHGSGIDTGIMFMDESTPEKIIFSFEFHHMNENGFYSIWTEHRLIITPSLQHGFNIKITGKNKNDIKSYLYDTLSPIFE